MVKTDMSYGHFFYETVTLLFRLFPQCLYHSLTYPVICISSFILENPTNKFVLTRISVAFVAPMIFRRTMKVHLAFCVWLSLMCKVRSPILLSCWLYINCAIAYLQLMWHWWIWTMYSCKSPPHFMDSKVHIMSEGCKTRKSLQQMNT